MYKQTGRPFQKLEIGLASPKEIRNWAERYLPNGEVVGEVTSWETVNYKTLKPEPNGLFCQRIFGPVIDYTCACGKKSNKIQIGFCSKCGVERTTARVRRYRLGYIQLKQPVVHTLYATYKPSPLSLCLNWSNKRVQSVMYGTEFCHLSTEFKIFSSRFELYQLLLNQESNQGNSQPQKILNVLSKFQLLPYFQKILFEKSTYFLADTQTLHKKTKKKSLLIPKLFQNQQSQKSKNKNIKRLYPSSGLDLGTHLYGISYEMTWRQVEDLQDFLMYIAEQPFSYEFSIPYYKFTRIIETKSSTEKTQHQQFFPIQTGGFVFQHLLSYFDLVALQLQLRIQYRELKTSIVYVQEMRDSLANWSPEKPSLLKKLNRLKQAERKCLRRLQYIRDFHSTKTEPAWMVLSILPVLPPGLRPITSIRGELVVSDINSLYRKLLTRNKRVVSPTQFGIFDTALSGSWSSWCYNLRQVQDAVDNLLKTGSTESGKSTKSLLDALKGKKGRFRQHLLGKRVDYSGRSVIVVGPKLKIHECGLPKQMAIELFQPFLIQKLRNKGIAFTTTAAKSIISERKPLIWNILEEILTNHPILLNRAPTLHRLGIQAFLPKLVEGKAILLHPLVCPAFNADFDGDQMAVHVPLSTSARAEAFNLLWSRNHLLSPASGQPLLLPTQDMVLGCYYLTISKEIILKPITINTSKESDYELISYPEFYFSNLTEVQKLYDRDKLETHTPVWVKWSGRMQNFITEQQAKTKEFPLEFRLDLQGNSEIVFSDRTETHKFDFNHTIFYVRTTPGRICFHDYLFTTVLSSQ
jgi:DNA-directed RNA polymerase subunit beta'